MARWTSSGMREMALGCFGECFQAAMSSPLMLWVASPKAFFITKGPVGVVGTADLRWRKRMRGGARGRTVMMESAKVYPVGIVVAGAAGFAGEDVVLPAIADVDEPAIVDVIESAIVDVNK